MRPTRRFGLGLATLALLSPGLAACGGDGGKSGGGVTLRMIESLTSPERTKLIRGLLDDFEKANPKINVELISPPLDGADQKIAQILTTKKDLDLLEVRDNTVKQYVTNGSLLDLTPSLEKWSEWSQLTPLAREKASLVGGKAYLVPYGFYQKTLFVRTDRLNEAGLTAPASWPELYDAAKKLTAAGDNRYGYSFRGGAGGYAYAALIIQAYNGDQVDRAQSFYRKDGSTIFASSEATAAMDVFLKLFKEASPPGSTNWSYPEMVQGFTAGVTSLLIQDPEVIKTAEEASGLPKGSWTTTPLPKGPSGYAIQPAGYAGWGVTSFTKHPTEATKLVQFLSSAEPSLKFAKDNSLIPIHSAATKDPVFNSGFFKSYLDMGADPNHVIVEWPYQYPGWSAFQKQGDADVQALLIGKAKPEDILKKWDAYWIDQKGKAS